MISVQVILLTFAILATINEVRCWNINQQPKIFGDDVPDKTISTQVPRVRNRIVYWHNIFRQKVSPTASNMLTMRWHKDAARAAQKWADRCHFLQHDPPAGRTVGNFGVCGQNIFVSTHKVPWLFVMKSWFREKQNFTYGRTESNNLLAVGHYTQMVWASTHKVGCGLTKCSRGGPGDRSFYNYVCDYCPIGNYEKSLGFPYKAGAECASCPGQCLAKKRLCKNSCNAVDTWDNCKQLNRSWPQWLCNTSTPDGLQRRKYCMATCTCHGKIYD